MIIIIKTWLINIAVLGNGRVFENEQEKREKYQELAQQMHKIRQISVNVVHVMQ